MAIIIGTSGDDKVPNELRGTIFADEIYGPAGSDSLVGFDGDDILEGGAGGDELWGGYGFDFASYRGSGAGVNAYLNAGFGAYGDAHGDQYHLIEGVIGSAYADILVGNNERNVLRGEGGRDNIESYGGNDLLSGGDGNDFLDGGVGADELRGGSGTDIAFYEGSAQAVTVDLGAGSGFGGEAEGDRLFSIEGVYGSYYSDRLSGNAAANRLTGYRDRDTLSGGGGADRFVYTDPADSPVVADDAILDFNRSQGDRIDLAEIDANEQASGNQAFQFIGKSAFTDAGQLRWYQQNGNTIVEANTTDLTAGPEMRIVHAPLLSLQATDFVL
jgi:Ca2+-binding RTX toxin-like protein